MIKKSLFLLGYSLAVFSFFAGCKKAAWNNDSANPGNAGTTLSDNLDIPQPIPALVPTLYFIEQFDNSTRTLFYGLTNLQQDNSSLALLHAGPLKEVPGYTQKSNWFFDSKNQEITYFSDYHVNGAMKEYYERYKLSNIGQPAGMVYWGGQDDQVKKYLGRGWAKFDAKKNILYYLASTTPSPYPSHTVVFDQIRSANIDGTDDKVVFEKKGAVWYAMDIDFANGRIYYTDYDDDAIYVVGTNGGGNKVVVKNAGFGNSTFRRNIKISPSNSQLYWIMDNTQKQECAIMSASNNGDNLKTIWKTKYEDITYGLDFDVDATNKKIYFCIDKMATNNGPASFLNWIDLDGKNAKVIYKPLGRITKIIVGGINN